MKIFCTSKIDYISFFVLIVIFFICAYYDIIGSSYTIYFSTFVMLQLLILRYLVICYHYNVTMDNRTYEEMDTNVTILIGYVTGFYSIIVLSLIFILIFVYKLNTYGIICWFYWIGCIIGFYDATYVNKGFNNESSDLYNIL